MLILLRAQWFRATAFGLLVLRCGPVWAQNTTASPAITLGSPLVPTPLLFLDAQQVDSATFASLNPADIASTYILKGLAARTFNPKATGRGILAITTKQNEQKPEVLAFQQQMERIEQENRPSSEAAIRAENAYQPVGVRYYLNGRASNREALRKLGSHTVTSIHTLHDKRAADYTHEAEVTEVFLITTQN